MTDRPPTPGPLATRPHAGGGGNLEVALRRHSFSTGVVAVSGALLVVLPVAVAVAITATVVRSASNLGGVLVGLVVPLALVGFAAAVARSLLASRRVRLVLRPDALVVADRMLFRGPEAIARDVVAGAWIGPAVDGWLGDHDGGAEVALSPDDEPVDLLLAFDGLVALDHARRRPSRPKGEHRAALPHPERPVTRLWVPLADPEGARRALAAWLPQPPVPAPAGAPPPPGVRSGGGPTPSG